MVPTPIAASTIAAQAFRLMELAPISSFADDSAQASDATEQYPLALRLCLELMDWSFARTLVTLPPAEPGAGVVADPDLPHTYRLPGDCLALRLVLPKDARWRRDADYLRADQAGGLTIRYTRTITDETALPAAFQDAVSLALAVRLAPRWVASRTKRQTLQEQWREAVELARTTERGAASHDRLDGRDVALGADWATEAIL